MKLEGMRCLITGCSSGIGRALTVEMASQGSLVVATARTLGSIADLQGPNVEILSLDVTDAASVAAAVAAAGPIDIAINNAGYGLEGAVEEVSDDELRLQYETNVFGPWRVCREVLPGMRARGRGAIVNISSAGGRAPFPGIGAYRSSKFALEGLSWTLHFEVSHFGIRVLIVEPGLVETDFGTRSIKQARLATESSPYSPMREAANAAYPKMSPKGMEAGVVAQAVASELRNDRGALRIRVGEDAERIVAASSTDDRYERFVVDELGFDWQPRGQLAEY